MLTILISLSPHIPTTTIGIHILVQCPGTKCLPNALYLVISGALIAAFLSVLASFVIDFVYLRDQCHLLVFYKILYLLIAILDHFEIDFLDNIQIILIAGP